MVSIVVLLFGLTTYIYIYILRILKGIYIYIYTLRILKGTTMEAAGTWSARNPELGLSVSRWPAPVLSSASPGGPEGTTPEKSGSLLKSDPLLNPKYLDFRSM